MTLPEFELDPRSATDEALASSAADDVDAFTELYRRYVCPIYRRIRSQVPSDAVAEDLTIRAVVPPHDRERIAVGVGR